MNGQGMACLAVPAISSGLAENQKNHFPIGSNRVARLP